MSENLMPTRQDYSESDVVLDLDAVNPKPIVITFRGKRYELKPISLGEFFKVYQALDKFKSQMDAEEMTKNAKTLSEKMIQSYADLFKSVCPELGKEVVREMSSVQAAALLTQILRLVNGEIGSKKNESSQPVS